MEDPLHPSSPTSTRSMHTKQPRQTPSKHSVPLSQKLASLKGIIRIPARRAREGIGMDAVSPVSAGATSTTSSNHRTSTDTHARRINGMASSNSPYQRHSNASSSGMKPYMSQPLLGLGLSNTVDERHSVDGFDLGLSGLGLAFEDVEGDGDGGDTSSVSASPEHSPSRSGGWTLVNGLTPSTDAGRPTQPSPSGLQTPTLPLSLVAQPYASQSPSSTTASPSSTAPSAWDASHGNFTRPSSRTPVPAPAPALRHVRKFSFSSIFSGRNRSPSRIQARSFDGMPVEGGRLPPVPTDTAMHGRERQQRQGRRGTASGGSTVSLVAAAGASLATPSVSASTSFTNSSTVDKPLLPPQPPALQSQVSLGMNRTRSNSTKSISGFSVGGFLKRPKTTAVGPQSNLNPRTESSSSAQGKATSLIKSKELVRRASRNRLNNGVDANADAHALSQAQAQAQPPAPPALPPPAPSLSITPASAVPPPTHPALASTSLEVSPKSLDERLPHDIAETKLKVKSSIQSSPSLSPALSFASAISHLSNDAEESKFASASKEDVNTYSDAVPSMSSPSTIANTDMSSESVYPSQATLALSTYLSTPILPLASPFSGFGESFAALTLDSNDTTTSDTKKATIISETGDSTSSSSTATLIVSHTIPPSTSATTTPEIHFNQPTSTPNDTPAMASTTMSLSSNGTPSGAFAPSSYPRPPFLPTSIQPRRTASTSSPGVLPRITLPPSNYHQHHQRFMVSSESGMTTPTARLSPSVIMRPPPLPLLNLPMLKTPGGSVLPEGSGLSRRTSTTTAAASNRLSMSRMESKAGLKSMPALPMEGTSRGVGGNEEVDDMEEDDEEEEEEEDEEDEREGESTEVDMDMEEDGDTPSRSSMSSERSTDENDESTDSAPSASPNQPYFGNPSRPPDQRFSRQPHLPRVDIGGMGLDLSFLSRPPDESQLPHGHSGKGKAKARDVGQSSLTKDAGNTPKGMKPPHPLPAPTPHYAARTPGASSMTPGTVRGAGAASHADGVGMDYFHHHNYHNQLTGRSVSESTIKEEKRRGPSPARTPRPNDYLLSVTPGVGGVPPLPISSKLGSISKHPGIYHRASRSLIDVHAIETKERVEQMVRETEDAEEEARKKRVKSLWTNIRTAVALGTAVSPSVEEGEENEAQQATAVAEGDRTPMIGQRPTRDPIVATPRPVGAEMETGEPTNVDVVADTIAVNAAALDASGETGLRGGTTSGETARKHRISLAPAYDALTLPHPLRRRRSMPTFNATTAPPPYPDFAPHPHSYGLQKGLKILPRDDEGVEKLPHYSNDIYLKAIMPRKLEFTRPGVQARDRKWRRVLCVLEGTSFKVYKCPSGASGVSAIGEWWESKVGAGDAIVSTSTTTSAFHVGGGGVTGTTGSRSAGAGPPARGLVAPGANSAGSDSQFAREIELARSKKSAEGGETGQPILQRSSPASVPQPPPQPQPHQRPQHPRQTHHSNHSVGNLPKSALNLAVQLLKPTSKHSRSNSDVASSPTRPRSPRSSLNIPRTGSGRTTPTTANGSGSSLRSTSPTMSASTSLTTPSSSEMFSPSSRPVTPSHSIQSISATSSSASGSSSPPARSGFRVVAGSHANSDGCVRTRASSSTSGSHFHGKGKDKTKAETPDPEDCEMIRAYTMQNAESGLGKDYLKRQHVIRVRLEGEQFLLQAKDVENVISWIEGLQSATNIALDLDERPMPAGPIFPRRRRRRRIPPPGINVVTANVPSTGPGNNPTPVSATQLVAPLNRRR